MTPERWQQIEEIFQDALDLSVSERQYYLAEKCSDDYELKSEVEKLLSQFEDASNFIETPAYNGTEANVLSSLLEFDEDDPMLGVLLGNYKIEREIGRGGMGAVYEAIRADGEFRRKVAIKIVKRGMDTDFILRRFRNERQILATLEHSYITRLLDGGTTDDGRPYFVMDYIEGLPLYRYSDKNRLTIIERLNLFNKICEAVEYAHTNLVIHRDLKPSNILVSADGTPRLLDFGIAKLLNPEMASDTLQPTATAMRMMTIDYASPEQINGEKVTFATDIYSLGVILFELLTGHRPYRFASRTPHEIARVICEESPMLPSDAITRSEETLPIIHVDQEALTIRHLAELRKNSPDNLREELRGNLDNITLKALCKLPEERYESVKKFREDIEKHLEGKPVSTPFYFPNIKNNAVQVAVLPLQFIGEAQTDDAFLAVGLADAMITRLSQVQRIIVRPTNSVLRFAETQDSFASGRELGVDFVLCGTIRPAGKRIRISAQLIEIKTNTTLWADKFDEEFTEVLELEDKVAEKVAKLLIPQLTAEEEQNLAKRNARNVEAYEAYLRGRYHLNLFTPDNYARAFEYFQEAIRLDADYALAYASLAEYYFALGTFGNANPRESFQSAQKMVEHAIQLDDTLGEAYAILGFSQLAEYKMQAADQTFRRAIALSPNYPMARIQHSVLLIVQGEYERAVNEAYRAVELNPLAPFEKCNYMWILYQAGRLMEAAALTRQIAQDFPEFSHNLGAGSWVLRSIGELDTSLEFAKRAVKFSPQTPWLNCNLAATYAKLGDREQALKLLHEIESSPATARSSPYVQAIAYIALGDPETAFAKLEIAYETRDVWLLWISSDAETAPLHDDPRYLKLIRKINPLSKPDNTIHQSNIPTKILTAEELKGTKKETEIETNKPSFFYRHRYKFIFTGIFILLLLIGYAVGIVSVKVGTD